MKTTLCALCFLCATAAFGQSASVLSNVPQPMVMPDHVQRAEEHGMRPFDNLRGESNYSYAQGEQPLTDFGTGKVEAERLVELVRSNFQLTPKGMIDALKLRRPVYRKTAAFGHFGRTEPTFTWEATDKAEALKEGARLAVAAK